MNLFRKLSILAIITVIVSTGVNAQSLPESGDLGIRANLVGQSSLEVPYMLNDSFSLAPYVGLNAVKDQSTTLNIGIRPRYYTGTTNALPTYFTGTLGFANTSFANANNSVTDFILGVGYGAEYLFSDKFSISGDLNLNSRLGDSNNALNTVARVSASFYF